VQRTSAKNQFKNKRNNNGMHLRVTGTSEDLR